MNENNIFKRLFRNKITKEQYKQLEDQNSPPPELGITFAESRNIIAFGLIIVFLFFGIGGAWVVLAKIGGAVISAGEIRIDTNRKTVQHLEGGIVREILVRDGDEVTAGQPLIVLESMRTVAGAEQVMLQIAAAKLEDARLTAEKNLQTQVDWPKNDNTIPAEKFAEMLDSERKLFNSNRRALDDQVALLNKQLDQLHQQDLSIDGRIAANQQIIDTLQEELNAKLELYKDGYIDKAKILELRRSIAQYNGQQAQLRGSQAELRERKAEFQLKISSIKNQFRNQAISAQSDVQKKLFDLQQRLIPLKDAKKRLTVVAPVDGVVVALKVHSVGGVIRPGEPLMDIVPKDSHLIVVCHVQIRDIAHIFKGQQADVQLSAFPRRVTPKIRGTVVYISADRVMTRTARGEVPSYEVHVELDKQQLAENNLRITAGMPAVVFIRTKLRTVLDYILEPLAENFDRAMREN